MAKQLEPEAQVRKNLLNLPGCNAIPAPAVSAEDRKNYSDIVKNYKPLIAELAMERMVDGLVTGSPEGLALLKIMSPYMFKKEAQVIETKNMGGEADAVTIDAIEAYLKQERLAEMDKELEVGGESLNPAQDGL